MPDDAAGVALTKVSSPFSKERGLDRERQVVRGVDLGAWSRDEAARPLRPPGGAPPPWEVASDLLGRACLYAEKEGAPPRAGVVVDARHAEPQRAAGALCVQIALAGRTTAVWVAVAPPNTAVARVWVGGGLCHAPRAAAGVPWPARTFHLLTPLPAAGAPSSSAAAAVEPPSPKSPSKPKGGKGVSPLAKGSGGGGSGGKASGGKGAAPAPGGALLVKFFGVPEGESVEAATPASLAPFEPAVDAPLTDVSPPERLHATLDALNWLRRNPRHDGRTGGGGGEGAAAAAALPPVEAMESLVGRAVEVLWPSESAWYPALVRAYNAVDGKHFLAYADGDVEWLALSSGCARCRPAAAQILGVRASSSDARSPHAPLSLAQVLWLAAAAGSEGGDAPRAAPPCRA